MDDYDKDYLKISHYECYWCGWMEEERKEVCPACGARGDADKGISPVFYDEDCA